MPECEGRASSANLPTILFVDDEPGLRALALEMLCDNGFKAFTAGDGLEALEQLGANPDIDVLISDIRMPRMGGEELLAIAQARNPALKVALLTGFADDAFTLLDQQQWPIFLKPFDIERLPALALQVAQGPEAVKRGRSAGMTSPVGKVRPLPRR